MEDILEIEDLKVNPHLLNLLPQEKIAYDDKVQKAIKFFIEKEIINKIPEKNDILEKTIQEILNEIILPKFGEKNTRMYANFDRIAKRFSVLANIKHCNEKFNANFSKGIYLSKDGIERLQNLYIKLGKNKLNTMTQIINTLDPSKTKIIIDDNQRSVALYLLALTLIKKEIN